MKINIVLRNILIILIICVGFILLMLLDSLVKHTSGKPSNSYNIMNKDKYKNQGLLESQGLETEALFQDDENIYYKDKVLKKFNINDNQTLNAAIAINKLNKLNEKDINFYCIPVPPRIIYEDGYYNEYIEYEKYIQNLILSLDNSIELIDSRDFIEPFKSEYIYFRTHDSWTALSAYHVYVGLFKQMGIKPLQLSELEEFMYTKFQGDLFAKSKKSLNYERFKQLLDMPYDMIYYYMPSDYHNTVTIYNKNDVKSSQINTTLISKSRQGISNFIGYDFDYAYIDGYRKVKDKADKNALMICDENGNIMASYMAYSYNSVVVINVEHYKDLPSDYTKLIETYNIHEVIWVQQAQKMGLKEYNKAIISLIP